MHVITTTTTRISGASLSKVCASFCAESMHFVSQCCSNTLNSFLRRIVNRRRKTQQTHETQRVFLYIHTYRQSIGSLSCFCYLLKANAASPQQLSSPIHTCRTTSFATLLHTPINFYSTFSPCVSPRMQISRGLLRHARTYGSHAIFRYIFPQKMSKEPTTSTTRPPDKVKSIICKSPRPSSSPT